MVKVQIICTRKHLRKIIREFHTLQILHIIDHKKDELDIGRPLEDAAEMSETLIKLRSIIAYLGIDSHKKPNEEEFEQFVNKYGLTDLQRVNKAAQKIYDELTQKLNNEKTLDTQLLAHKKILEELEILSSLNLQPSLFKSSNVVVGFAGSLQDAGKLIKLKEEITAITNKYELSTIQKNGKLHLAIFTTLDYKAAIQQVLSTAGFNEIKPDFTLLGTSIELKKEYTEKISQIEEKKKIIREQLIKAGKTWGNFLIINEQRLGKEIERSEAPMRFAETKSTSIITGWIPEQNYEQMSLHLHEITQGKIYIEKMACEDESEIPIKLKHEQPIQNFEFFMNLYSLPKYTELDPTLFMFITFPLFFGFMLGDIGYGLLTLFLFMFLKKKIPEGKFLFNSMMLCSVSSIFFGFIFGEFFGFEELGHFVIPHLLSRAGEINTLLIVSIIIGALHINIGFIFGFINELHHGFKKALFTKGSWLLIEAGAVLFALSQMDKIGLHWAFGAVLGFIAIVMLFLGEGIHGLIELPTIASHTLSYARLMAVGLASVFLAMLINDFGVKFIEMGGFHIVLGIFIMLVGHLINITLGIIGPFLHSLRLHYVEFFTKFYKGGGKKYTPFGLNDD
jgi:V/A-type H+-transporting ATPase subunit I